MNQEMKRVESSKGPSAPSKGHQYFIFVYDDTGAEATVTAPNGWSIRQVVDQAYGELGEVPRQDDRVEFDGQSLVPYYALHVKEFVERGIAPDLRFNIVSNPGGATR
jgi:hypothetical protein